MGLELVNPGTLVDALAQSIMQVLKNFFSNLTYSLQVHLFF